MSTIALEESKYPYWKPLIQSVNNLFGLGLEHRLTEIHLIDDELLESCRLGFFVVWFWLFQDSSTGRGGLLWHCSKEAKI